MQRSNGFKAENREEGGENYAYLARLSLVLIDKK